MSDYLDFCNTETQREKMRAIIKHGSPTAAAKALGLNDSAMRRLFREIKGRAALAGYSPDFGLNDDVPPGFSVHGVSVYKEDSLGNKHWLKVSKDKLRLEDEMRDYMAGLVADMKPYKSKPVNKSIKHDPNLMTGVFIGDAHIGMYAYGKETKHSDFDSDIATKQLRDSIDYLVDMALPTETGLLVDVGDFTHSNGQKNTTYEGTPLDCDTRHSRVMLKAAMVMRYMVDKMLTKFKKVVVVVAKGNHNTDTATAVRGMVAFYYERDKRVNVLQTDGFYHYIEYGKWLLGIHHGDKQKPESLAGAMARDMSEAWGRTTSRMWCTGHFHKDAVKSLPGVKHKVFAALPPPDSWHASHGFTGDGEMEMLTFRKSGGIHSSHVYHLPQPKHEPDVTI